MSRGLLNMVKRVASPIGAAIITACEISAALAL